MKHHNFKSVLMKNRIINNFQPNKAIKTKSLLTALALVFSFSGFAQTANPAQVEDTTWLFSNGLFDTLLGVIILLLIIIAVLGGVLLNVARFATEKRNNINGKALGVVGLIAFLALSNSSSAQVAAAAATGAANATPAAYDYMGLGAGMFYLMLLFIAMEIVIIMVLFNSIQVFLKRELAASASHVKAGPTLLDRINATVPIEKEADILLDHNYDGIQELDNDLPPWWKYGFYITIIFAVIYITIYHITKTSDLQGPAYEKAMEAGRISKEEYQKKDANNVTENNVKLFTDKTHLDEAADLFKANCAVCHGKLGEGIVGPNLTDDYWIHGGSIKNIFHTITFGWPDKGMKSWQADFSPLKIDEIASYVISLKGTNPPNGKAPQGDMYVGETTAKSDSTKTDSTKVKAPVIDSTKAKAGKKK